MNGSKRDYYEVLGVPSSASEQQIKSAYRKKALEHHPDRNPERREEAEEKFKESSEAYSVLGDPQKRAQYDRLGHAGMGGGGVGGFDPSIFTEFEDIVGDFFGIGDLFGMGSGGRRARSNRGSDLRYDLEISFEEAAFGLEAQIKVPRRELCGACHGSGAKKGTSPVTCSHCGGRGQVRYTQGFFSLSRPCPACQGAGQVIRHPCPECRGQGRVRREKILQVRIPAGVDTGTRLRVPGEGEAGTRGAAPGDLYVVLTVSDHPFFERHDRDLACTVPLSFWQAALGGETWVPTLQGEETLKIPEGTQTGKVFRIRGHGIPDLNGRGRGDLYVQVRVQTPTRLTSEQRQLLQQLAEISSDDSSPPEKGFFDKVKDYFSG